MLDTAEKKDINFQPPVKGYSYSNSPQQKASRKKPNIFLTLSFGILGFFFLFFLFLAVLNYFNIVSLNSINPTLLGWLPKTLVVHKTPSSTIPSFEKLANQTTDAQMSNYIALINAKKVPLDNSKYPDEIYGIFSGFNNNYIQVVTYNGIKNLPYSKDLTIQKYGQTEKSATSSAVTVGLTQIDKNSFFNQSMFGKTLHLSITLTSPKTIQQIYLTE